MNLQQEIKKRQPFESPEQEACLNLVRTGDLLQLDFTRLFREHGLSPPLYNVLRILRGAGGAGLPCLEVAGRMIGSVPDITRLIDRLEKSGQVERTRSTDDRRVVLVRITPAGLKLLARLDKPVLDLHQRQLGHLSRKELAQLNQLLLKARRAES
jgi:DNA-binding MarR family transcriptional regulator